MNKREIYLAGNISNDPDTYRWRVEATNLLKDQYSVLNPTATNFEKNLLEKNKNTKDFVSQAISLSQGILITKDFQLVNRCDLILVNLQIITPEKPFIGTLFELAWAWYLRKPIIAIVGDNLYAKHPFMTGAISAKADSLEKACDIIKEFFDGC